MKLVDMVEFNGSIPGLIVVPEGAKYADYRDGLVRFYDRVPRDTSSRGMTIEDGTVAIHFPDYGGRKGDGWDYGEGPVILDKRQYDEVKLGGLEKKFG